MMRAGAAEQGPAVRPSPPGWVSRGGPKGGEEAEEMGKVVCIGVAGGTGSGKTTVAEAIVN
ncbi:MAG: hypothetical protein V1750_09730, partial [Acidobacteriota bacterium]